MAKRTIYFLRHGQTQFNVFRRLQGWSNSQLTPAGIQVAIDSGKAFAHIPFEAVYSSDLTRAVETGEYFLSQASAKTVIIQKSQALREIGFGYYEGQDGMTVWRLAEHLALEKGLVKEGEFVPESIKIDMVHELDPYHLAENYEGFIQRLVQGMNEIVEKHLEGNLLIVSHSSSIKALFNQLDPHFSTNEEPANGSLSVMTYEENVGYQVQAYSIFSPEEL